MHPNINHTHGNKLYSFPKKEKLTSKIIIDRLFKDGQSRFKYPFRILFLSDEVYSEPFPQLVISVSKRNFKRAVNRNRIKRLIREAYRLQKHELVSLFMHAALACRHQFPVVKDLPDVSPSIEDRLVHP